MLYMPVLHKGYLDFFKAYPNVKTAYILAQELLNTVDYLRKDLRALTPAQQVDTLVGLSRFDEVKLLSLSSLAKIDAADTELVMPDEDVSHQLAGGLKKAKVNFYPVFLRWDRRSVENVDKHEEVETVTEAEFTQKIMTSALGKAKTSSDIWRRVGAVLITADKKQLGPAANQGEPNAHSPWMEGDPRNIFNRGVGIEMSVFSHAEAVLIAEAAKSGIKLEGATIYVTTFPCPACAKLIARSGIANCYYKEGYAVLDGGDIMKEYGVKVIKVIMPETNEPSPEAVAYKSSSS